MDFAVQHRKGLSQMMNVTAQSIEVDGVCGSAHIKGTAGALVRSVALENVTLAVTSPLPFFRKEGKPWLISCDGGVDNATVSALHMAVSYRSEADKVQWRGIQPTPGCLQLE